MGLSSPGNLIIGEGAAFVAWIAMKWIKNTLRTTRRQLNIVGNPIFLSKECLPCGAVSCSPLTPSACVALEDFFSLTGHPAPRHWELLLAHALFPTLSAQSPGWARNSDFMLTHMLGFLTLCLLLEISHEQRESFLVSADCCCWVNNSWKCSVKKSA